MTSKVPNGFGTVATTAGYIVGIKLRYCSLTAIRTTSKTTSTPGAETRSVPVAAKPTPTKFPAKIEKETPA